MTTQVSTQLPDRMQRMGQDSFPTEIWINIFSRLERTTLREVVLCCRHFHELISPLLFSNLFVEYCDHRPKVDIPKSPVKRLRRLVLYLLQTPDLTSMVEHIRLLGPNHRDYSMDPSITDKVRVGSDVELEAAIQKHVSCPSNACTHLAQTRDSLLRTVFDSDVTLHTQLLLDLLPQAKSLHIQMPDGRLFESLALDSHIFYGLREMTLEWKNVQRGHDREPVPLFWPGSCLGDVMAITSLRKLCIIGFTFRPRDINSPFAFLKPESLSISHIEFRDSLLHASDSELLFEAFRDMKTFIYTIEARHTDLIPLSLLLSHLSAFQHNHLKCLWLEYGRAWNFLAPASSIDDYLLTSLSHLQSLVNMQHLCLTVDPLFNFNYSRRGRNLLSAALERFPPSLKTIVLLEHFDLPAPAMFEELQAFFEALLCQVLGTSSSHGRLDNLERVILIAPMSQLTSLPLPLLVEIEQIQRPKIMFVALDRFYPEAPCVHDGSLFVCRKPTDQAPDEICSAQIDEIEDLFGMTQRFQRTQWHVVDMSELRHIRAQR